MRKWIVGVVVLIVLVFVGTQLLLPPFVADKVGEAVQGMVNGAPVDVHLSTFPAVRLLTGNIGRLDVTVENFAMGGLAVAGLRLEGRNVDVDVAQMWRGRSLSVPLSDTFTVEAVIAEDSLTDYVSEQLTFPGDVNAEVTPEGVRLTGDVLLGENELSVVVVGRFEPLETDIGFVVDDLTVEGTRLPAFMLAVLKEAYTVRIDVSDGPLPMVVDEIVHETGRIIVRGRPGPRTS